MENKVIRELKILDFDLETIAAGFADPEWVPQKITCAAWSWIHEKRVHCEICTPLGLFGEPRLRGKMLEPLVAAINEADILTGHNLIRFDLPILQSELLRLGMEPLGPQRVHDTIRLIKTKGFKKGQDNLGALLKTKQQKFALTWQGWEDGYDEPDWATIKARACADVIQHKQARAEMIDKQWLKSTIVWRPKN